MAETQPWPLWRTKASRLGEWLGRKWDLLMLSWQGCWNQWAAIEQFKAITLLRQQGWNCLWADLNQTTMPTRVLLARMSVCLQTVSSHAVNVPGIDSSLGRMENRRIVGAAVACNNPDTREAIMFKTHQAIEILTTNHNLSCLMQIRHNDATTTRVLVNRGVMLQLIWMLC